MLRVTKIFRFEMAHAISHYNGPCENIHGHSYTLHVTLSAGQEPEGYLPSTGFFIDFKAIKKIVRETITEKWDHALLLSKAFVEQQPSVRDNKNLIIFEAEPTAENMLLYMRREISKRLPEGVRLEKLLLYETCDSYAEWSVS